MSSAPSLKYSKRLAVIGAASAAVLSLGTASAAVTTVNTNGATIGNIGNGEIGFNPIGSSFTINGGWNFPAVLYCHLTLMSTGEVDWGTSLLGEGAVVDAAISYISPDPYISIGLPEAGVTIYLAYRYTPVSGNGTDNYYGYVSITGAVGNFIVNEYTYESTPNTGITITVPEPSAALLAFAGAGLFLRRRRA